MKLADFDLFVVDGWLPPWPGPADLVMHYADGWEAFQRADAAFSLAVLDAEAEGWPRPSRVLDPAEVVPDDLSERARAAWCGGWCERMYAYLVINEAVQRGVVDPDQLFGVAAQAIEEFRARSFGSAPRNRRDRRSRRRRR
ncbi:hypothetical protein [Azospirillum thermophilum]|uniref:Uncharacterized protein n=1 Tax=Azospirillum thermophilum TaxID=2202148 RepID=A0A2S2CL19_9PROT|nr:hypothetical protein [Azospirillum thermophilum]AWK85007.1 hypothetical protein DEW08_01370 [Azospirillum thermophilum]